VSRDSSSKKTFGGRGFPAYASDDQNMRTTIAFAALVVRFFCSPPDKRPGANTRHTGVRPQDERLYDQGGA
jgi:hypothetical protein